MKKYLQIPRIQFHSVTPTQHLFRTKKKKNSRKNQTSQTSRPPNKKHLDSQIRSFNPIYTKSGSIDEVWSRVADTEIP